MSGDDQDVSFLDLGRVLQQRGGAVPPAVVEQQRAMRVKRQVLLPPTIIKLAG